ncbi:MAG TPA: hypothetical protein VGH45_11025 [Solirubrobacteraceae bacterium]|jgi:hypothetical protein
MEPLLAPAGGQRRARGDVVRVPGILRGGGADVTATGSKVPLAQQYS